MVDRALELARAGYCVHPLRAGTKRARFEVWQELATTDEQTIRQWWALHPDDNIGIGIKASGLLIVTPDCADRLTDFQQRNGRAGAPDTMRVQSRSGAGHEHWYYRRPAGCPDAQMNEPGDYDLLTIGNLVAPGSRVPRDDGTPGEYRLLTGALIPIGELPEAPAWAVAMVENHAARQSATRAASLAAMEAATSGDEPPVRLAGRALERWQGTRQRDGDRSGTLFRIACDLWLAGATIGTIASALHNRDLALHASHRDGPKYAGRRDPWRWYLVTATNASLRAEPEPPAIIFDSGGQTIGGDCGARVAELERERDEARARHAAVMSVINNPALTANQSVATIRATFERERLLALGQTIGGEVTLYLPELIKGQWIDRETGEPLAAEPRTADEQRAAKLQGSMSTSTLSNALKKTAVLTGAFTIREKRDPKTGKSRITMTAPSEPTIATLQAVGRAFVAIDRTRGPGRGKPRDPRLAAVAPCETCGDVDVLIKADAYCTGCGERLGALPDEIIRATDHDTAAPFQIETVEASPLPTGGVNVPKAFNLKRSSARRADRHEPRPFQIETTTADRCGLCRRPLRNDDERAAGRHDYDCMSTHAGPRDFVLWPAAAGDD